MAHFFLPGGENTQVIANSFQLGQVGATQPWGRKLSYNQALRVHNKRKSKTELVKAVSSSFIGRSLGHSYSPLISKSKQNYKIRLQEI